MSDSAPSPQPLSPGGERGSAKPFPFYPLIVAAFPVLSVYSANLAYVPAAQLVRPLLAVVGATALLALGLGLALRSAARGAAGATVAVLCAFGYAWFLDATSGLLLGLDPLFAWGVATVLLSALAAWRLTAVRVLNVLAVAIALVAGLNLGLSLSRAGRLAAGGARADLPTATDAPRPDVFYIVLDGHGRTDAIRRSIGFDNSSFIQGLRDRGFYVADRARANYCQTELSLASSLNMDTVPALLPNVPKGEIERKPLADRIEDNEVVRRFRARGYTFVAVTSGFPPIRFDSADLHLGGGGGASMVETTLLQMTPLARSRIVIPQFEARRIALRGVFEDLASLAAPTPSPRLVIAHVLAPHPPFVFDANGNALPRKGQFGYFDGDDYTTFVGTKEDYRRGYAGQVEWVEKQVLQTLDRLLARPGPKPVILIQGDHGSKLHLAQNDLAKTDLNEVFPILDAFLVPDAVRKDLRPDLTPVNSFRILLHGLFGDDLPQIPDQSWYSRYATPYDFTDVTDRVEGGKPL